MCHLGVYLGVTGAWFVIVCETRCTARGDCNPSVPETETCAGGLQPTPCQTFGELWMYQTQLLPGQPFHTHHSGRPFTGLCTHQVKNKLLAYCTFLFSCFSKAVARLVRGSCVPLVSGRWDGLWGFGNNLMCTSRQAALNTLFHEHRNSAIRISTNQKCKIFND